MIVTRSCMGSALEKFPSCDHPDLAQARFHLESAYELADRYYKTWHSIIWINSKVGRKKSVRHELNSIAYDIYTELIMSAVYINKYTISHDIPDSVIESLNLAYRSIHQHHGEELNSRQLELTMQPVVNLPLKIKQVEYVLLKNHEQ